MPIVAAIAAGLILALLAGRVLFYDREDLLDGFLKVFSLFFYRRDRWPFAPKERLSKPEDFEDESWSSGIRFFVLLLVGLGSGWLVYRLFTH